ncbi:MAG: Ig-like domain-containing protein, partial [Archangium sp.]
WGSGTTSVVRVAAGGLATSVSEGTSVISATSGAVTGSSTLTVTAPVVESIAVTPAAPSVALGRTQQFVATATMSNATSQDVSATATWSSGTTAVATISASGLATTLTEGSSSISATSGGVTGATTLTVGPKVLDSIDVAPNPFPVQAGGTDVVSVTGHYSDGTTASVASMATYTPADPTIATVSGGTVSGLAAGSTVITVAVGSVTTTFTVNVTSAAVTLTSITINGPTTLKNVVTKYTATGNYSDGSTQDVTAMATWASSTVATATVSDATGKKGEVTPVAFGSTNLTATVGSVYASLTVVVANTVTERSRAIEHLVISQIFGGGGNSGAPYRNDFFEIHNPTNMTVSLSGKSLQYASATGSSWTVTTLSGSIPPGGFYLVQGQGSGSAATLPTPDATGNIQASATVGKLALASTIAAFTDACPTIDVLDFVGFGGTANCSETAVAPAPSNTTAIIRQNSGCREAGNNSTDFVTGAPTPRNSASARVACDYFVNDLSTTAAEEINYCALQFPTSFSVATGAQTPTIYARVFQSGVTEAAGAASNIVVQLGYGANMTSPLSTAWNWVPASFNVQVGNDDEYQASFVSPMAAASYAYTARASLDGVNWTACDINGAGSNGGLDLQTTQLGVMTVTP